MHLSNEEREISLKLVCLQKHSGPPSQTCFPKAIRKLHYTLPGAQTPHLLKLWGMLPIQFRHLKRLQILSLEAKSIKSGSIKLTFWHGCSQCRITCEVRNVSVSAGRGLYYFSFSLTKSFSFDFQGQTFPKL